MAYQTILLEEQNGIATLTLNRPERLNAINRQLVLDFVDAVAQVMANPEARVLVVKGAGRAFCSGDDLRSAEDQGLEPGQRPPPPPLIVRMNQSWVKITKDLLNLPKPVIAALHGYVLGAGMDVALACDFRIAAEDTQLGIILPQRALGGVGPYLLPKVVGLAKAKELLLLGDMIDGREAERIGLVNQAVPREELDQVVAALADRFAHAATRAIGLVKTATHQSFTATIEQGMEYQLLANMQLAFTEDSREGTLAWRERRDPQFTGR